MKKFKKILFVTLWVCLIIGLFALMSFVNNQEENLVCKSIDVKINQNDDVYFLDKMEVENLIKDRGDSIVGQPRYSLSVPELERALDSHEDIAKAQVNVTIDGDVKVVVKQRKPILRIFNSSGDSYYIDEAGKLMPLSEKYTARVLIANGNIKEAFATNYMYSIADIGKDSVKAANSCLDELFSMATYINKDKFWQSQISQIYVNSDKEMELIPLVGNNKIIFGDTTQMKEKFNKLMTFYTQGLSTTGYWERYSTVNLKFKNQIVCTKK